MDGWLLSSGRTKKQCEKYVRRKSAEMPIANNRIQEWLTCPLQKKKGYHIIHSIIYLFFIHSFRLSASAVTTGLAPVRCAAALLRHGQENNALLAALLAEVIGDAACAFFAAWVW